MIRTLGVIQAGMGSPEMRKKLARKLRGKSLLEWIVRLVSDAERLDHLVVEIDDAEQEELFQGLVPSDVPVQVGTESDALASLVHCAERHPCQAILRVRTDHPFLDPSLLDRLVASAEDAEECDYASYGVEADARSEGFPRTMFAEWFCVEALRSAHRETRLPVDRQQPARFFFRHPDRFAVKLLTVPASLDRHDVRMSIECEEDWEHAEAVFEALGHDEFDWQRLASLLRRVPTQRPPAPHLSRRPAVA